MYCGSIESGAKEFHKTFKQKTKNAKGYISIDMKMGDTESEIKPEVKIQENT